jgi:hypothetical protein
MANYGSAYPSGINPPAIRPSGVSRPPIRSWAVLIYDMTDRSDRGFVISQGTDRDQALSLARGRAKTIEREGYTRERIYGDGCFYLSRPGEGYLVTVAGDYKDMELTF